MSGSSKHSYVSIKLIVRTEEFTSSMLCGPHDTTESKGSKDNFCASKSKSPINGLPDNLIVWDDIDNKCHQNNLLLTPRDSLKKEKNAKEEMLETAVPLMATCGWSQKWANLYRFYVKMPRFARLYFSWIKPLNSTSHLYLCYWHCKEFFNSIIF